MRELNGRIAVVTGAGSGIGRGLALGFAGEGMKVVLADIDEPGMEETRRLIAAAGGEASVHRTDVRDESAVQALARHTIDTYGAVHLVCNNAGVEWGTVFLEAPIEGWKWVMDVNFWGTLHGCRVFLPLLAEQEEAHLINVASSAALNAVMPTFAPYSVSKFAVLSLSEYLAAELRLQGSKVGMSLLVPGFVKSELPWAQRHAPADVPDTETNPLRAAVQKSVRSFMAGAKEPSEVAEQVIQAVREDRFFILTHPDEQLDFLRQRLHWMQTNEPPEIPGA